MTHIIRVVEALPNGDKFDEAYILAYTDKQVSGLLQLSSDYIRYSVVGVLSDWNKWQVEAICRAEA